MVAWILCRTLELVLGMLYPAYASYKAVKNKNIREYVRWMMYWIVFSLFMATEAVAEVFLSWVSMKPHEWIYCFYVQQTHLCGFTETTKKNNNSYRFPFYYEIKMAFVVWLLSPYTRGASLLYRKFVHPTLSRKEKEIDMLILQAKERSYETLVSFGKKSLNVAATAAVQAATKGQGALAGRLRSFSMQDLSSVPDSEPVHYSNPLYLDEQDLRRQPIGHRMVSHPPGSDSNEDCWSDSELSTGPRWTQKKDTLLPKPLSRSQSLRVVKRKPPTKEGSVRLVRGRPKKKVVDPET